MVELEKKELHQISGGGGTSFMIGCLIAGAISFLIGVFDGYIRPLKCNS